MKDVWTRLNRFEQVFRESLTRVRSRFDEERYCYTVARHFFASNSEIYPRKIISVTQRAIFRKVSPANSDISGKYVCTGQEGRGEGAIGGRKKRGIRLFTCKTTPEDTASYNSANVGSVGQRLCALAHGGVGNKSRWPVCPRIFRVTWNYFASLAKVARAPASIAAARFPRYCETPRFTTHHPSLNLAPIKTRSKASLLELLLTFVSDHAFVRLYLRFVVHLSGETVDGGAKKFAPLIAFGVNQELLLSSGWKLLLEAKLRAKIRVGE